MFRIFFQLPLCISLPLQFSMLYKYINIRLCSPERGGNLNYLRSCYLAFPFPADGMFDTVRF